eukprot:TRINITY_DN16631_c0_g1_i1.p1 TRINITY_DN16631_c0_g1~~TRINITY_DN16631_c0_g1_i1.p1  ORF type:complete len:450 (-),score=58.67 TRINITY_DN16631_c0_g1_i1:185-1534(-)
MLSDDVSSRDGGRMLSNPVCDQSCAPLWVQRGIVVARPGWCALARVGLRLQELSGGLGDLGTFLPLTTYLAATHGIHFGAALVWAGVFNLLTVLWFDVPVAVQPMHTICAVAISQKLENEVIAGAGMFVALSALVLGLTNMIDHIERYVPLAVVRGIQLGLGMGLVVKGITDKNHGAYVHDTDGNKVWVGQDSILVSIVFVALIFVSYKSQRLPSALILFIYGLVVAGMRSEQAVTLGVDLALVSPSWHQFGQGVLQAGLPQLPLTLLNSVVALSLLAKDLYPSRDAVSTQRAALSVGGCNLVFVWFGAIPSCHGAGGLAAQHRFGARTAVSMLFLGVIKLSSGLLFGSSLHELCGHFPACVLGVLLSFSGVELAVAAVRNQNFSHENEREMIVLLVTAGFEMALKSGVAFIAGCAVALLLALPEWVLQKTSDKARGRTRREDEDPRES